jgi:hypothetical protein
VKTIGPLTALQALRRAAVRATMAPSVWNTQPWRLLLRSDELIVEYDRSRRLRVLDQSGRQMLISCGSALFNARVALRAAGYEPTVELDPDPIRPQVLARLTTRDVQQFSRLDEADLGRLDGLIEARRTNGHSFTAAAASPEVVEHLVAAAAAEGAQLVAVTSTVDRLRVARLARRANAQYRADPAYQAEQRAWVGRAPAAGSHRSRAPVADQLDESPSAPGLLVLGTASDSPAAWLRAGEALERVLLDAAGHGFVAALHPQVVEVPETRAELCHELGLTVRPHLLVELGQAASRPPTRRRRLVDVLVDVP